MIRYSISILTYTQLDRARHCIASVVANSPAGEYELILTANGPIAASYFKSLAGPNVTVIENAANEGFIEPSKRALEKARGEFFVALNDDATVPPGWLERLRAPFDSDPMMGLTGPEGGCCHLSTTLQGQRAMLDRPLDPQIEYIEFACAMARTEVLRKVGLFAPELVFAYWEDTELSIRLREQGYKLKQVPFRIEHKRAATSGTMPDIRKYQQVNGAYMRRRHAGYFKARRFDYVTVIKRHAAHGDVLLTTPIIRALKERNPRSPIWVETICTEVLRGNPLIEQVGPKLPIPRDAWVIDLNGAYENAPQTHIVSAYAMVAGVRDYSCRPEIFPQEADHAFASVQLEGDGWIAVHPGPTTWPGKNWPLLRFEELIAMLGAKVVLVGTDQSRVKGATKDLRGRTTMGQLAAVLARCRLLITVDSLPLHIAQSVGCPIVPLFGVTSPEFIVTEGSAAFTVCSDRENPSTGLRHRVKGATMVEDRHECMSTITVDAVMAAVEQSMAVVETT